MQTSFFLAPTGVNTGLTSICLGFVRALDRMGVRVAFCKPISQSYGSDSEPDRSTHLIKATVGLQPAPPLPLSYAQQLMSRGLEGRLMEEVIHIFQKSALDADVIVIEGLVPIGDESYIAKINWEMARALNSNIILVTARNAQRSYALNDQIEMTASLFGGVNSPQVLGCILNKIGAPNVRQQHVTTDEEPDEAEIVEPDHRRIRERLKVFHNPNFKVLGAIPWNPNLIAPRTKDVADYLRATVINEGHMAERRVQLITLCARTVPNMLHTLKPGTLLVTPGDRTDIMLAVALAAIRGVPLAGIVFTGDMLPPDNVLEHCDAAMKTGLPIILCHENTWRTAQLLNMMNTEVPADDVERMDLVMDSIATHLDANFLMECVSKQTEKRLSPAAFRHQLVQLANKAAKRIVLPEGHEPRTIEAAIRCHEKGIARCVLLGKLERVTEVAVNHGLSLPSTIEVIDPDEVRHRYIPHLVKMRKHKGMTEPMAENQLGDNVALGTLMLSLSEVDGLVSGAVHTTANTIRPALQLIKTKPGVSLVSSVFFMCLPDQVLVYGDCAVNPDPNAEELADIAIQSGLSAKSLGIEPRIAMISYSTGTSGTGSDVDKVRRATEIAKEKCPELIIDGPLQYDAASDAHVARSKAPDSPVAGKATVFIFPDLNTGNTTYKAVQRSAKVVSIGPMLQGMAKPVNDLSRGATVEDIVYTIALTAIQAGQ